LNNKLVVGLTGSSGIIYGLRLLRNCEIIGKYYSVLDVIVSDQAIKVALYENNLDLLNELSSIKCIDNVYRENDWLSPLASSSNLIGYDMIIIPASLNTIAKLANGIQDNLLLRVAASILRVKGRLVVVFRETPLSAQDLLNLYKLSRNGAVIMPASPAFYIKPKNIDDLINFIVGKVFDVLGIKHDLYRRWRT